MTLMPPLPPPAADDEACDAQGRPERLVVRRRFRERELLPLFCFSPCISSSIQPSPGLLPPICPPPPALSTLLTLQISITRVTGCIETAVSCSKGLAAVAAADGGAGCPPLPALPGQCPSTTKCWHLSHCCS